MNLTPLDIQKKEFKRSFRGFDEAEVKDFLEKVSEVYEKIYKENQQLKEEIKALYEKLKGYEELEATLKKAIVLAEKTAEEVRMNAEKERELLIKEANNKAKEIIAEAEQKKRHIIMQQEELERQFIIFKTRFVNFLKAQLEMVESIEIHGMFKNSNEPEFIGENNQLKEAAVSFDGEKEDNEESL